MLKYNSWLETKEHRRAVSLICYHRWKSSGGPSSTHNPQRGDADLRTLFFPKTQAVVSAIARTVGSSVDDILEAYGEFAVILQQKGEQLPTTFFTHRTTRSATQPGSGRTDLAISLYV